MKDRDRVFREVCVCGWVCVWVGVWGAHTTIILVPQSVLLRVPSQASRDSCALAHSP